MITVKETIYIIRSGIPIIANPITEIINNAITTTGITIKFIIPLNNVVTGCV
ncbi:hypothetical protein D3C76_1503370 [compost metagenome]